jgi:hypothetical protein
MRLIGGEMAGFPGSFARTVASASLAAVLFGCQPTGTSGALRAESAGAVAAVLPARFRTAVYHVNEFNVASFYLWDGDAEALLEGRHSAGQFVHVEVLWTPIAGRTAVDQSALNCSVRHVIFANGEWGVYGGAGLARLSSSPGASSISVSIPEASLTLLESSASFADPLTPAYLTGRFTARLDEKLAQQLVLAASQAVTNRAGRPMFVHAASGAARVAQLR